MISLIVIAFATIIGSLTVHAETAVIPVLTNACSEAESWSEQPKWLSKKWTTEFYRTLRVNPNGARAVVSGFAYRKIAKSPTQKAFAEYWIARGLGLNHSTHLSFDAFGSIIEKPALLTQAPETAAILLASFECLDQIRTHYPTLIKQSPAQLETLGLLMSSPALSSQLKKSLFRYTLSISNPDNKLAKTLFEKAMSASSEHPDFNLALKGVYAAAKAQSIEASQALKPYFALTNRDASLKNLNDNLRILLARAQFQQQNFDEAVLNLKQVSKNSNALNQALSDLAWAQLQGDFHRDAIGTVVSLQAGHLKKTFAPEAPMVMAMAFNELCLFPESLKAIQSFKKTYGPAYLYLDQYYGDNAKPLPRFYQLAIQTVRKQSDVPFIVSGEWIRSPLFISRQTEINLAIAEISQHQTLVSQADKDMAALSKEVLDQAKLIEQELQKNKNQDADSPLPEQLAEQLRELKSQLQVVNRYVQAFNVLKKLAHQQKKRANDAQTSSIAAIEKSLQAITERMYIQLQEIADNNQLVEVEIYQGASQDIVWQNANPEYKKMSQKMADKSKNSQKTWDWGKTSAGLSVSGKNSEIWEDELGSFQADVIDNCESKDKFLALGRTE